MTNFIRFKSKGRQKKDFKASKKGKEVRFKKKKGKHRIDIDTVLKKTDSKVINSIIPTKEHKRTVVDDFFDSIVRKAVRG